MSEYRNVTQGLLNSFYNHTWSNIMIKVSKKNAHTIIIQIHEVRYSVSMHAH